MSIEAALKDGDLTALKALWLKGNKTINIPSRFNRLMIAKFLWNQRKVPDPSDDYRVIKFYLTRDRNSLFIPRLDLASSVKNGHLEAVKLLRDQSPVQINQEDVNEAAGNGHLDMIKFLWSKEDQFNQIGANLAAFSGHLAVVKFFWSKGIEALRYVPNWQHWTILYGDGILSGRGQLAMIKFLWSRDIRTADANVAAANGYLKVVKFFQSKGIQATQYGAEKAAENGHLEVVKFLKSKGIEK